MRNEKGRNPTGSEAVSRTMPPDNSNYEFARTHQTSCTMPQGRVTAMKLGNGSGATITELSEIVGLDQSNAGHRFDAARQKCKTDPEFESTWKKVQEKYKQRIAISHV